jgi:uncharacterized protein YsxB (DUF464 family)
MITAEFDYNLETFEASLIVKGHASFAEIGTDIVCASASILTYTISAIVQKMWKKGRLTDIPVIRLEGGDACISCECEDECGFIKVLHAFETIKTGFTLLAENYPQNVNVKA